MDGPLRISFLAMIATGAFAIAVLSFTGAIWPYAEPDGAREHLAYANAITFVTFLCGLLLFAGGALVSFVSNRDWHANVTNTLSSIVFVVGFFTAGLELTQSMSAWFEGPIRMSDGMIMLLRSGFLTAFAWLFLSLGLAAWLGLRKRGSKEAREN